MGHRRMISRKIVESARFLKMPATTQNLYFHLVVNADDDGIVEAYSVLGLIKANEDDLRILVSKKFVYILNEDLVTFIEDWREQNTIRADRKSDSIYKELLLQLRPDIKLVEKKERSDTKKAKCIDVLSVDCPRTAQDNISQDNISQDNISQDNIINQSINQGCKETMNDRAIEYYKELIAENIELDILCEQAEKESDDEKENVMSVYNIICDTVCYPKKDKIKVKSTEYDWSYVKELFLTLRRKHVANTLKAIFDLEYEIKDMKAYIISCLFNEALYGAIREQKELNKGYLKELRGNPYS